MNMHKKIIPFIAAALLIFISCNEDKKKEVETVTQHHHDSMVIKEQTDFKDIVFDSKKDFVCGMPVSAGISDTAHYKGKVYGFCSKECKDEFYKNPSAYVASK
jgi:YHS domain-containing protein